VGGCRRVLEPSLAPHHHVLSAVTGPSTILIGARSTHACISPCCTSPSKGSCPKASYFPSFIKSIACLHGVRYPQYLPRAHQRQIDIHCGPAQRCGNPHSPGSTSNGGGRRSFTSWSSSKYHSPFQPSLCSVSRIQISTGPSSGKKAQIMAGIAIQSRYSTRMRTIDRYPLLPRGISCKYIASR